MAQHFVEAGPRKIAGHFREKHHRVAMHCGMTGLFSRLGAWRACRMVILTCVSAWGLACAASIDGPSQWLYRSWQTDEGLPDNSVTGIAQSSDGYLWVGTRGGLVRFNGNTFTAIPLPPSAGIPNRVVRIVLRDSRDRLWLGMERGWLVSLDRGKIRVYGQEDGLPNAVARSIIEDPAGDIWISYPTGITRISNGQCHNYGPESDLISTRGNTRLVVQADGGLAWLHGGKLGFVRDGGLLPAHQLADEFSEICASASGGLWVCEGNGVRRFADGAISAEIATLPDEAVPRVMLEDRSGALWIGTASNGLFRMENGRVESVPTSHSELDCLLEDREGNLWAGTVGGGLNQVRTQVMTLIDRQAGIPSESARSVCEDATGGIWVAFENGQLARFAGGRWVNAGRAGVEATCVAAAQDGSVWLGSRGKGLHRINSDQWQSWSRADGLVGNSVRSILVASDGKIWVASEFPRRLQYFHLGKFHLVALPPDLSEVRSIRALTEAADGTIWIATAQGELMRVADDRLVHERATDETLTYSIRTLHATRDGSIWIGHAGFGLSRWKDGVRKRITIHQGLRENHISQVMTDNLGTMWIAGNRGLFKVKMDELENVFAGQAERLQTRAFGRAEGLAGLQASFDYSPSNCQGRDGRLWLAMRNGLLMIRPDEIRENPTPPPVVLERVAVDDATAAVYDKQTTRHEAPGGLILDIGGPAAELRLLPGHNKLEFEFAALSFTSPENIHFRYQLRGFDQQWVEAGTKNRATYPRLPGGDYEFRVTACNNAGVWNETGASLHLIVEPFYWQTWWFRALAVAFFTAAIIAIVRYVSFRRLRERMRELKQQATLHQERARIARDMHDEVGAKLTRLSLLSDMATAAPDLQPGSAADVREISDTARETILAFDEIVWAVNPRNDTLGDLVGYLCRHAEDFFDGSATLCVFELPKKIPAVTLATEVRHEVFLAAKEALTNAAKYAAASRVCLRLSIHPAAFDLIIEDDGGGFDPAAITTRPGGGNGLRNMRDRMERIGGRFELHSGPGSGTRVVFHVPISQ
jgi:signal transduction histidine kinase/ligand-binding sensor domain-containing protein